MRKCFSTKHLRYGSFFIVISIKNKPPTSGLRVTLKVAHNPEVGGSNPSPATIKLNQKRYQREKPRSFNGFRVFLRPFFEVGKKDIKKGFGKISGLEPLPTRFWAAFPGIFRESGSFLLSAKCRISTGVFVGLAEHSLQAQIPAR